MTLIVGLAGCARGNHAGVVGDSTFVRIMADLRHLDDTTLPDSAAREASRRAILARHHVTVRALDATAREMAADPERAIAIWKAVDVRLQAPPPPAKEPAKKP